MAKNETNTDNATKPLYAVRDFHDSGTERHFKKGKMPEDVDAGLIENYRAAGLVSDERPASSAA